MTTTENQTPCPSCIRDDDATLWAHTRGEHEDTERTQLDNDHCPACGFDLGTHRPKCPRSYGPGNYGNPNRPTPAGYCASCGRESCLWYDEHGTLIYSTDYHQPAPITLEQHGTHETRALIDTLTETECRDALMYLSGRSSEFLTQAIRIVKR